MEKAILATYSRLYCRQFGVRGGSVPNWRFRRMIVPDFAALIRATLCLRYFGYRRDRLFRIKTDRFGPFDQFDQGDALFAYFDVTDIGL